ncbi:hypothetical protein LPJ61_004132, partial [Coemansia biformis]
MGNAITKQPTEEGLGLHKFRLLRVIGRGSFGKVRIVEHRATGRTYALKYISKAACISNRSHTNTLRERDILEDIEHPYIVNLRFSFQDDHALFMVMDLMAGGDLRFHIMRRRFFEGVIKFWIAELACAIHHLHSVHHTVHRDVKPDNILMDHEGHVALTDFNIATRIVDAQPHYAVAGTANYMAPEVVSGAGYTYSVDWWSLGVVMYECIYGKRPFRHKKNTDALKRALLYEEIQFPIVTDVQVSYDCVSAMRSLLNKEPHLRLGCGPTGYDDIKAHPFFASLDWERIEAKQVQPPFVPTNDMSNFDISHDLEEMLLEPEPLTDAGSRHRRGQGKRARAPTEHATPEYRMLAECFATFDYVEYEQLRAYIEAHGSISALAIEDAKTDMSKPSADATLLFPPPLAHMKLDDRPIINLDAQSTLAYSVTLSRGRNVIQQLQTIVSHADEASTSAAAATGTSATSAANNTSYNPHNDASPDPPPVHPPSLRQRISEAKRRGSSSARQPSDTKQCGGLSQNRLFGSSANSSTNTTTTMPAMPAPADQVALALQVPGTLEPPSIVPIDILAWNQLLPSQRTLAHRYCIKMARERHWYPRSSAQRRTRRRHSRADLRQSNVFEFPRLGSRVNLNTAAATPTAAAVANHRHTPSAASYTHGHPLRPAKPSFASSAAPAETDNTSWMSQHGARYMSTELLDPRDRRASALRRQLSADNLASISSGASTPYMSLDMRVGGLAGGIATPPRVGVSRKSSFAHAGESSSDGDIAAAAAAAATTAGIADGSCNYYRHQPLPPPPSSAMPVGATSMLATGRGFATSHSELCMMKLSLADAPQ